MKLSSKYPRNRIEKVEKYYHFMYLFSKMFFFYAPCTPKDESPQQIQSALAFLI